MEYHRVLIVDNHKEFLDTRAEYLENAEYSVLRAYTLEQARQIMRQEYIHVAIIDIRMVDDDDPNDTSGITLAKDPEFRAIPKIMLTGRPSHEYVRASVIPGPDGLAPAVDFIVKDDGPEAMIDTVKKVFAQQVKINKKLTFRWAGGAGPLSFVELACRMEPEADTRSLPDRAGEVEDLFRKVFPSCEQVTVSRIYWRQAGRLAVSAFAYTQNKREQFLVTLGLGEVVKNEGDVFEQHASQALRAASTELSDRQETRRYAAIKWELRSAPIELLQNLPEFLSTANHAASRQVLKHLFESRLRECYDQGRSTRPGEDLVQHYRKLLGTQKFSPMEMDLKIQALRAEALTLGLLARFDVFPNRLALQLNDGVQLEFSNPLPFLEEKPDIELESAPFVLTPGVADPHTILVSPEKSAWLTDFAACAEAPAWYDFIVLEASLRFILGSGCSLLNADDFEKQILGCSHLGDVVAPETPDPGLKKCGVVIETLRDLTAKQTGKSSVPYEWGLLHASLARFRDFDETARHTLLEVNTLLHCLLLAGRLAGQLEAINEGGTGAARRQISPPEIRVDAPSRRIWVGNSAINLTGQEFKLFAILYDNIGEVTTNEKILKACFPDDPDPEGNKSWLTTYVGRLRRKLRGKFLIENSRGAGYCLVDPQLCSPEVPIGGEGNGE